MPGMKVTTTTYTVADYCDQLERSDVIVNRDYQRTDAVWPPAARSYLIETILLGYPLPKMSLFQKTDLRSRKTVKEIVDGQQRSTAILDFYKNMFRLTGRSQFTGKRFRDLNVEDQQNFISYQLSFDLLTAATEDDIRQMFRRMNSYSIPLNAEELRHATHQGVMKWHIVELTERYSTALKTIGVFSERNLSRMQDARLFTEVLMALQNGIETYSSKKLDKFYLDNDKKCPAETRATKRIQRTMDTLVGWDSIHGETVMKPANVLTLMLAVIHCKKPVAALDSIYPLDGPSLGDDDLVLSNIGYLSSLLDAEPPEEADGDATDEDLPAPEWLEFYLASVAGTNTKDNRSTRFRWYCKALQPESIS